MNDRSFKRRWGLTSAFGLLLGCFSPAHADLIVDWNETATKIVTSQVKSPAMGNHILAKIQTAVFEATNAVTQKYPVSRFGVKPHPDASVEAAIASASHAMLSQLVPKQQDATDQAFRTALDSIADSAAKAAGIALGKQAADAVGQWHQALKWEKPEPYRPATSPGVYVPTVQLAGPTWGSRPTWVLPTADSLRPPPPPALNSAQWAKDYKEVKTVGSKGSIYRTAEQTKVAIFWSATSPSIYFPVIRSVGLMPGRDLTRNARLFATAAQAMDDALVAVFEAKYHYRFWRPVTAIRNGDNDGNDATDRHAHWSPLIKTPMHPEYPCAHCIVASAVSAVIKADLGDTQSPLLTTTSPALPGVKRSWKTPDEFAQEVSDARIFDGVHYRTSANIAYEMGQKIGLLADKKSVSP